MHCRLNICSKALFAFILLVSPAFTAAQDTSANPTPATRWQQWIARQKQLPIGAWAYNDALNDESVLQRYTSAGFNVLPKANWPKATVPAGASAALDLGMSTDRSTEVIQRIVKSGPTPTLVLLGQEAVPEQFKAIGEQSDAINLATDGAALALSSLLPNWYCYFDRLNITYEQYVEQYIAETKCQALMAVELPLMADGTDRVFYYDELAVLRRASVDHNIGLFGLVQAVGHGPRFRQPSASDIRWQVYSYLAYGAKGLWYYYFAGDGRNDGLTTGLSWYPKQLGPAEAPRGFGIDQSPAARQTFAAIRAVNAEVAKLSPTLLKLRSTGVFHIGNEPPPAVERMRADSASPLAGVTGDGFLVGVFQLADKPGGDEYVLIVNERHGPDAQTAAYENSLSFTLKPKYSSVEVIDTATGNARRLEAGDAGYTLRLSGGQGVLLHCR